MYDPANMECAFELGISKHNAENDLYVKQCKSCFALYNGTEKDKLCENCKKFLDELESAARLIREGVWSIDRACRELRNVTKKDGRYFLP